mgnify:CR=1 FL=1
MPSSRLEIDLRAVDHNIRTIRGVVSPSSAAAPAGKAHSVGICAVLKQDAYGLGAVRLAKRATAGQGPGGGVELLAVFAADEARELAEANVTAPVLVLAPVREIDRTDALYRTAAAGRLHVALHDEGQLDSLAQIASRLGVTLAAHVFLDTGMGRGGALPSEAARLVARLAGGGTAGGRVALAGVMTHFSSADSDADVTREQARVFREWIAEIKPLLPAGFVAAGGLGAGLAVHAANTCGTLRSEKFHGTMVRVGQSLYGYGLEGVTDPENMQFREAAARLQPAVRWTAPIVHVKEVPAGFPVGYGSTWRAPARGPGRCQPTRLALVPVGYADGYPRALSQGGVVALTGRRWERSSGGSGGDDIGIRKVYCPVVGRVSMDQITVDVTDAPEEWAAVGMEVEIFGRDKTAPNYPAKLAAAAGSITHELLCRVSSRVERVYRYPAATGGAGTPVQTPTARPVAPATVGGGIGGAAAVAM